MKNARKTASYLFLFANLALAQPEKRKSFDVPLAMLSTTFSKEGLVEEVFVSFDSYSEGWAITPGNDRYIKDNRRERVEHIFREPVMQTTLLSSFEASILDKVCSSFRETLKIFEKDLKSARLDRCRYLDYWMPVFIKNFYYLYSAARNSDNVMLSVLSIPDSLFDTNPYSVKTDERIRKWYQDPEHVVKLRITTHELIYQIEQWQKKELTNPDRDVLMDYSKECMQTLELFTKLYFNLSAPSNSTKSRTAKK